ncbi:hypothetical protein Tco_1283479 [Tanacetum coccineum]
MGSYSSTMKPSDVKALTHKYKIPRDLHPVAVSSEWTMDRLDDDCIGLYEQYFEFAGLRVPFSTFPSCQELGTFHVTHLQLVPTGVFYKLSKQGDWFSFEKRAGKDFRGKILNETFSCMKKWKGRFFFIDRRAIPDAMCWRHHDSDISDPAPKDGFDEADVVTLTHQPIDIRGIPTTAFCAGLAVTREFPKFLSFVKDPRQCDETIPGKTDSQQRVETSDPKIVATRIRKAQAAAKRKTKNRGGENVVSPTQAQGDNLLEIPAHDSANTTTHPCEEHHDEHSGVLGTGDGDFDDDVDEEVDLEGPERHPNDTTERVVLGAEPVPPPVTRPDNGKSIAQEETPIPDPLLRGVGADGAGSSLPPPLFVSTWGIHQRSRVTTPEECP